MCFLVPGVETKVGKCAYQTGSCISQYDESLHNQYCTGTSVELTEQIKIKGTQIAWIESFLNK